MLEGLPPNSATRVLRLTTTETPARRVADLIGETFDPAEVAVAAFEVDNGPAWSVEAYFGFEPDEQAVRDLVAAVDPALAAAASFATLDPKDWVGASLEGLKPVPAGRFIVHGGHDRGMLAPNAIGLEIEAALAFGTGHHGTTRGCLLALDDLLKRRTPLNVLDIGTGTGVLALAAARATHRPVLASDIDRVSVIAARANARLNHAGPLVHVVHAPGLKAAIFRRGAPYDLIFANILLRPLISLSRPMRALVAPGGTVILSGLLDSHAHAALNAYRAQGLHLVRLIRLEGWTTLVLVRRR
jgi:ribosomal protein L11 methyltransferase